MLNLVSALESDAETIAAIHMAAFGSNAMLLAQFPSPTIRDELKRCIAEKALADIQDPMVEVLVVRDQDQVVSFAKWHLPVIGQVNYQETPWRWPQETNLAVLNMWAEKVEAAKHNIIGDVPCYRLSFIATHPAHERRGAASLLLQWALERCTKEGVPAYLESTSSAGSLYEKCGFGRAGTIVMTLDSVEAKDRPTTYEETCFLFRSRESNDTGEEQSHFRDA